MVDDKIMFECACGFTSGTAHAFYKHIKRFEDEGEIRHRLVNGLQSMLWQQIEKEEAEESEIEETSPESQNIDFKTNKERDETLTSLSSEAELVSQPSVPSATPAEANPTTSQRHYSGYSESSSMGQRVSGAFQWTMDAVKSVAVRATGTINILSTGNNNQQIGLQDWRHGTKVKELEDLLLWKDKVLSWRALLLGLYFIIFGRSLIYVGLGEFIRSSSFVALLLLLWMMLSIVRSARIKWRDSIPDGPTFYKVTREFLQTVFDFIADWASAALLLIFVHIIRGNFASRLLVGILIWAVIFVGEVRLLSQEMSFSMMYISLFVIPVWYVKCKHELDFLANQLAEVSNALARQNSKSVAISFVVGIVAIAVVQFSIVVRACVGVLVFVVMIGFGLYRTICKGGEEDGAKIINGGYVYLDHRDTAEQEEIG